MARRDVQKAFMRYQELAIAIYVQRCRCRAAYIRRDRGLLDVELERMFASMRACDGAWDRYIELSKGGSWNA